MQSKYLLVPLLAALALVGCDRDQTTSTAPTPPSAAAPEHKDDHNHDDAPTDSHGGPMHQLGTTKIGEFDVAVVQVGEVTLGEGATFEIRPSGAEGEITAVRAWVGVESGQGSVKVKAPKRGDFYDADLEVPSPLPDGSQAWVEIETAGGKSAGPFPLER